jgi:hypothetical protein
MFTVKAVSSSCTQLFKAHIVLTRDYNGPVGSRSAPQFTVELQDEHQSVQQFLHVGSGDEDIRHVYVMNENGKTVEQIFPTRNAQVNAA